MTTYYYPATYGSAELVGRASVAGVRNFKGQYQAPANSYIVVTPIEGTRPQQFTVTVGYTGPGTGYTGVATQTRHSDANHLQAFTRLPTYGPVYLVLSNGPVPANLHYIFPLRSRPFQFSDGLTTDPTAHSTSARSAVDCFAEGTLIRTTAGDTPVECLAVGDRVVTVDGTSRAIIWLGRRAVACRAHPRPWDVQPVRVAAHAFGDSCPTRDLFLSPGHPVLVGADEDGAGGWLVPIMCLVNGTTVCRVAVDAVVYWHVELASHDILLAEGLAAESYIDLGSRAWFAGDDGALRGPDLALPEMPGRCRPVAVDGAVVEAERRRLDLIFASRLAGACAWPDEAQVLRAS